MKIKTEKRHFHDYIMPILGQTLPITSRAMFGGYGLYYQGYMFACIVDNVLYFRVDEMNKKDFVPFQSVPFSYAYKSGKVITLPYLSLPEEILDDQQKCTQWILKAFEAAKRGKKTKK
jgi:DNA transformation protein and related proteins